MRKISSGLLVSVMLLFTACNGGGEKAATTDTTKAVVSETPKAPEFKPFDVVEINHVVKDYAVWKKAFDADSTARIASGLGFIALGKSMDNPNNVSITLSAADLTKAKAFAADPRLKDVMQKNGVISKPEISYWHVLRANMESKEKNCVLVKHKVKDFNAWVKVFDGEGTATRATYGLVDVALCREVEDSNMVQLVFDIKDMVKAKARMSDPALKKLMMDAGVDGAPKIEFYSQAE
jgi:hypothetical protein